jgi:glycosyltransferase involved in cell wall biosynthesis
MFFQSLIGTVKGFLSVGSLNRDYYLQYGVGAERIFPVPWCVDNKRFQAAASAAAPRRERLRASLGLDENRAVILFVGRLIERKRPRDLLEAYALLLHSEPAPQAPYLLYVGDGEMRSELVGRAAALRLDRVKFLGFKNQSELPEFYDLCDVFVMPSVYEPWGLVVNEVMNASRAVVVSDQVGCAPDLVSHNVNGLVFRACDVPDLHRALNDALADPVRLAQMGAKSLDRINRWSFEEDVKGVKAALEAS